MESMVVFWHKSEGDWVDEGDILVEIQTEKAVFEIEVETEGYVKKIIVPRGEVAYVGDVLAIIEPVTLNSDHTQDEALQDPIDNIGENRSNETNQRQFVQTSPRVRRLAKELGVDLSTINGTGPNGRPTEKDIRKANQNEAAVTTDHVQVRMSQMRQTIAKRMMESIHQSAQLTETTWADITVLSARRKQHYPEMSWNVLFLYATVLALKKHPILNSTWEDNGVRTLPYIHLGIAVDTEHGLLVPVVKHAEEKSLEALSLVTKQLIEKAKKGQLSGNECQGSTFTVTNLGGYGVQFFTPIINPPEAAILGVGHVEPYLVLNNNEVEERLRLPISLTFDHRVVDGAPAAKFLQTYTKLLSQPEQLKRR